MGTNRLMTIFMFIAVFSLLTTSLSYNPQEAYASVTGGIATTGFLIIDPPEFVGQDNQGSEFGTTVLAFDEKQDVLLAADMTIDLSPMGESSILAGTTVSATTIVFDPPTTSLQATQGCVSFDGQDILGIQFLTSTLLAADDILKPDETTYADPEVVFRGIEPPPHGNNDQVFFVGPKVCFILQASTPGDTFRVITVSDHVSTVLWQIGVFDNKRNELTTSGNIVNYNANIKPINNCGEAASNNCVNPIFPSALGNGGQGQASQVDISFTSGSCENSMLVYSRAGIENDEIILDNVSKGTVMSAEGVFATFSIDLGQLSAGSHVLTVDYQTSNNTPDDWHSVDALALVCWEDAVPPQVICEPDTMDLIAGQTIDSGDVTLINDGTTLLITIQTQDDWQLSESHVQIGEALDDFPLTKKGNPKVGNFDYQREYDPLVTEDTYEFLLADLGLESGDTIIFAVHTVVVQTDSDGEVIAEETAWKQGERFVEKGNWAMYNMYDIQECDVIE